MHGHGHILANPDGSVARCGGPAVCLGCAAEREVARLAVAACEAALEAERARWWSLTGGGSPRVEATEAARVALAAYAAARDAAKIEEAK